MNIPTRCWSFISSNIVARIFQGIFRERQVKTQDKVPNDAHGIPVPVNLVVAGFVTLYRQELVVVSVPDEHFAGGEQVIDGIVYAQDRSFLSPFGFQRKPLVVGFLDMWQDFSQVSYGRVGSQEPVTPCLG